jgi:hypothetical protein
MDDPLFTVVAKKPEYEDMAAVLQKILDHVKDTDRFRDMVGIPRKGREPDYVLGRWCIRCHNSLPDDWKSPCDVCGSQTVFGGILESAQETR